MPHHTPFIGTIVAGPAVTLVTAANARRPNNSPLAGYKVGDPKLEIEQLAYGGCTIFRQTPSRVTRLGRGA